MCISAPKIEAPPAPKPVMPPTLVAPPKEVAEPTKVKLGGDDKDKRKRRAAGRKSLVNPLNIPSSPSSGGGLNIPY